MDIFLPIGKLRVRLVGPNYIARKQLGQISTWEVSISKMAGPDAWLDSWFWRIRGSCPQPHYLLSYLSHLTLQACEGTLAFYSAMFEPLMIKEEIALI